MGFSLGLGLGLGGAGVGPALLEQALALATPTNLWDFLDSTRLYSDRSATPSSLAGVGNVVGVIKPVVGSIWCYAPSDTARGVRAAAGITFNGSNNYYQLVDADSTTPTSIPITTNMTIMRGFRRASAGIGSYGVQSSASGPEEFAWYGDNGRSIALNSYTSAITPSTATGRFVSTTTRNATTQKLRINGADVFSAAAGSATGALEVLGRRQVTAFNNGDVSAVAVFTSELTGAALTAWEVYMASLNGAVLA